MPSIEILFTFFIATLVFAYIPGPALLYTAAQTIARGRRAGWLAALGLHVGGYFHVIAAALGLSVLFTAVPVLYTGVKIVGACYLVWLGIQIIRSREEHSSSDVLSSSPSDSRHPRIEKTPMQAFRQSAIVEILNPKTAIFFIAFLPQFTDPAAYLPIWAQLLILGTIVNVIVSSADIVCVLLSSSIVKALARSSAAMRMIRRIGGSILVLLGINLAFSRQL